MQICTSSDGRLRHRSLVSLTIWDCEAVRKNWSLFMKSILDRTFRYTPSVDTDLRKTFARIRREQRLSTASGAVRQDRARVLQLMPVKRG